MTTRDVMAARIADELARSDLTSQIVLAINDAIDEYQNDRWTFNESRSNTFSTVANQWLYTSSDAAFIGNILKFDYMHVVINSLSFKLQPMAPEEVERLNAAGYFTGQPLGYVYYNKTIQLFPIPNAAYTVRFAGLLRVAAPASGSETDNPWMTTAERMIRSRAKYVLAVHVLQDMDLAARMQVVLDQAERNLRLTTNNLLQRGPALVTPTQF